MDIRLPVTLVFKSRPRETIMAKGDWTLHHIYYIARRKLKVTKSTGIFLVVNDSIPLASYTISQLNSMYAIDRTSLEIHVLEENTFGGT